MVQVRKEPERKNTTNSYMWVYCSICSIKEAEKQVRFFEYQPERNGTFPQAFLKNYKGYIHTDAYKGYKK